MQHVKSNISKKKNKGSSLVESMIAVTLFTITATSVYPVFVTASKNAKQGDSRSLCQSLVRQKLDQYRNGRITNEGDVQTTLFQMYQAANPTATQAQQAAQQTSINTNTRSTMGSLSVGTMSSTNRTTGGFYYSKIRYNIFYPQSCKGQTAPSEVLAALNYAGGVASFGMRECVGSDYSWDEAAVGNNGVDYCGVNSATVSADKIANIEIPNFKLYVKLELSTAWNLPIDVAGNLSAKAQQYSNSCPNFGDWTPTSFNETPGTIKYDFDGSGDGIKITVTGLIDSSLTENNPNGKAVFAGIKDPNQLLCQETAVVNSDPYPIRYYLSRLERRIYTVHGTGTNGGNDYVFQSFYNNAGSTDMISGIDSFTVHPRNLSAYTLSSGSLVRYSNCGGIPITCSSTGNNTGITDVPVGAGANSYAQRPDFQIFNIPTSITNIGVNYKTGAVYGFTPGNGVGTAFEIRCATNPTQTLAFCGNAEYLQTDLVFNDLDTAQNAILFNQFTNAADSRVDNIFMSHEGDELYVLFNDFNSILGSAYTASIYRANDTSKLLPIAHFPLDVIGFSK